jgi:hypothetical protein
MKFIYPFIVLFFLNLNLQAQKTLQGIIKDKVTNENLAYVNVGIVNQNSGTVSDANGKFEFKIRDNLSTEDLKISLIGYNTIILKVSEFANKIAKNEIIYLEKSIAVLKEIVIKNKNLKTATLGNILGRKTVSAGFVNNVLGNEIGIIIKIQKKPTFIESFNAIVDYNKYKELKFRINFYNLKKGLPNNTLLQENIIVTSTVKNGLMTIDLDDYNIVVYEDFFVSIELIEGMGEGGLHFLADYDGIPIITRSASQGKWNKQKNLSFGFNLTTKY